MSATAKNISNATTFRLQIVTIRSDVGDTVT